MINLIYKRFHGRAVFFFNFLLIFKNFNRYLSRANIPWVSPIFQNCFVIYTQAIIHGEHHNIIIRIINIIIINLKSFSDRFKYRRFAHLVNVRRRIQFPIIISIVRIYYLYERMKLQKTPS